MKHVRNSLVGYDLTNNFYVDETTVDLDIWKEYLSYCCVLKQDKGQEDRVLSCHEV